jgi:hypothetical protein
MTRAPLFHLLLLLCITQRDAFLRRTFHHEAHAAGRQNPGIKTQNLLSFTCARAARHQRRSQGGRWQEEAAAECMTFQSARGLLGEGGVVQLYCCCGIVLRDGGARLQLCTRECNGHCWKTSAQGACLTSCGYLWLNVM